MRGASRLMPPVLLFVSLLCLVSTETDPLDGDISSVVSWLLVFDS